MKGWMGKFKVFSLLGFLMFALAGCGKENLTALLPKGDSAHTSMKLIILTTIIMTAVFLVVIVVYVIVLLRFRKKKGQEDYIPKQVEGHIGLETVWTIIPIILVLVIAVPTTVATFDLADDSNAKKNINIDVTGNQFWWHFNYTGDKVQTSQDLYIPTGKTVYLHLKSTDVIHSFWVPALAGKIDANVENTNTMKLKADEEGVYWGKCAEFCGDSHSLMDFKVIAVSPEKYDQWVKDMKNFDPDQKPETATAQEGKDLFKDKNCMGCHAIGSSPIQTGPNLTDFGNRSKLAGVKEPTKENIMKWIQDPESIKPGNKMTGKYPSVSKDEAEKLAEYLMQLKPSDVTPESVGK